MGVIVGQFNESRTHFFTEMRVFEESRSSGTSLQRVIGVRLTDAKIGFKRSRGSWFLGVMRELGSLVLRSNPLGSSYSRVDISRRSILLEWLTLTGLGSLKYGGHLS